MMDRESETFILLNNVKSSYYCFNLLTDTFRYDIKYKILMLENLNVIFLKLVSSYWLFYIILYLY